MDIKVPSFNALWIIIYIHIYICIIVYISTKIKLTLNNKYYFIKF